MRGRTKLVSLVTVLAVLLTSSLVFAMGVVDVSKIVLINSPGMAELDSPGTPNVFFAPATISGDYVNDPGFEIGQTVYVGVNISDVTDLYSYQINVTWTPGILDFIEIANYGDLLDKTDSIYGTSRGELISFANNTVGCAVVAETILGDYAGITDLVGGQLFNMTFEIVGYGWTELNVGLAGGLNTTLLDSDGVEITAFTTEGGWFDNRIRGDSDGSGIVTIADMGEVSDRWTSPPGLKPYARFVDWDDNDVISIGDMGIVSDNWLRFVP